MEHIKELVDLLTLEKIEENIFRGKTHKTPWKRVFGGQVLGQSLRAAFMTVSKDRCAHSFHGYFILPGDIERDIIYTVESIRDGGSFTTRRVVAVQHGRPIFIMAASFQEEQKGFEHQIDMPSVPHPDQLVTDQEWAEQLKEYNPRLYNYFVRPRPIEFKPVEHMNPANPTSLKPFRHVWFRVKGEVKNQGDFRRQIIAYASDYNLLLTSTLPHLDKIGMNRLFMASIDHAMWFHRQFDIHDWFLFAIDSPSASNTRGFTRGNIFSQDGSLIASVSQEGLIREWRKE